MYRYNTSPEEPALHVPTKEDERFIEHFIKRARESYRVECHQVPVKTKPNAPGNVASNAGRFYVALPNKQFLFWSDGASDLHLFQHQSILAKLENFVEERELVAQSGLFLPKQ